MPDAGSGRFTVSVDPDRCELHGECVIAAPEIFSIEEGNEVVTVLLLEIDAGLEESALDAMYGCPVQAITVSPV